jgi:hypothetical protein
MELDILVQIANLPSLSRPQLLDLWLKLYGSAAPLGIRRELMVPFLAYKIQEIAFGGLKTSTRSELRRMARDLDKSGGSLKLRIPTRPKPGTRIFREWRGESHEVIVTEAGYEHCGVGYGSLSEVARKITGVRWSGPAFFRLKITRRMPGRRHD